MPFRIGVCWSVASVCGCSVIAARLVRGVTAGCTWPYAPLGDLAAIGQAAIGAEPALERAGRYAMPAQIWEVVDFTTRRPWNASLVASPRLSRLRWMDADPHSSVVRRHASYPLRLS